MFRGEASQYLRVREVWSHAWRSVILGNCSARTISVRVSISEILRYAQEDRRSGCKCCSSRDRALPLSFCLSALSNEPTCDSGGVRETRHFCSIDRHQTDAVASRKIDGFLVVNEDGFSSLNGQYTTASFGQSL